MIKMSGISVSAALKDQLQTLCLRSFPCGSGSWAHSYLKNGKSISVDPLLEMGNDPQRESLDDLNDLVTCDCSPWKLEDGCSPEIHHLRLLAIKCPENITDQFVYSYFTSLRVVDKEVSDVDEHLLRFHNLKELVLSVNKIKTVHSSNLPRTLKVLELCSNQISSLKELSTNPPPTLQHLGLAYNKIQCSSENMYLTAEQWSIWVLKDRNSYKASEPTEGSAFIAALGVADYIPEMLRPPSNHS
ncbi:leucine-rich repeat-containing 43 isoform X1 [Pelobates cultripes]|uniref:Leucine-rich repeat-containing 43 isoform X1 n=1 Tax=Pelobates cultripes TaxID=61616 RepID=A0AAD1SC49_PELCU|nr:leucine-rich repeat-containing 43 isoform X1 [Pelobates cultripes]